MKELGLMLMASSERIILASLGILIFAVSCVWVVDICQKWFGEWSNLAITFSVVVFFFLLGLILYVV